MVSTEQLLGSPFHRLRSRAARYGLAAGVVALGWFLRLAIAGTTGEGLPPYITFYPAVMVAALLAGFGPGLLATALAALLADYRLLAPAGFGIASGLDMAGLALFCAMGVFVSIVAELYRRARTKAAAYDADRAMHETKADLKHAQAIGKIGSWRLDVRRNELTWSEETHRIFGILPGTPMSYETFLATVHPADREYVDQKWQAALRREPYDVEHRLIVAGQVKWVRERAELEFSPEGELLGGFGTCQDITERKEAEEARRTAELARHLIEVQENERRRLAEALHDRTSANLATIGLELDSIAGALPPQASTAIRERVEDTRALLADTVAGIRDICFDLRPASLDYWGLLRAAQGYADQFAKRTGVAVRVEARDFDSDLSQDQEVLVFRIIQEALTNCAKHAGASAIDLVFEGGAPGLRVTIADDGVGFEPATPGGPDQGPGMGLLTMRERAEYAGGTLRIESRPGGGTRVVLEI